MTRQTHPREERTLSAPWLLLRVQEHLDRLKQEPEWQNAGHDSITLMKTPGMTVVLIALRTGAVLREHRASGPVAVQVFSGRIKLMFQEEGPEVCAGEIVTIDPLVSHQVSALEDSAILLFVAQ